MIEWPFVGVYWGPRAESRIACARRTFEFLTAVSALPGLDRWFQKGRSRATAVRSVELDPEAIAAVLRTNRRDDDRTVIPELGFDLGLWNGNDEWPMSLNVHCGATSIITRNAVVLGLDPLEVPPSPDALRFHTSILEAMVGAWDPDDGVVTTPEFMARAGGGPPWVAGGWFTYKRGEGLAKHL